VLYEMMMMAVIWVRIGVHSTGRASIRQSERLIPRSSFGTAR
jgi:hypothetical protein